MRRMMTTKQSDYVNSLSEVAEKGFKVGTYPAQIDIVNEGEFDWEVLKDEVLDEQVDFENHTFSAGLRFEFPTLLKEYGLGEADDENGYVYYTLSEAITMPNSVVDFESLKVWMQSEAFISAIQYKYDYDEYQIRNLVASYEFDDSADNIVLVDGELKINTYILCTDGEGEEIVGASDPIGVDVLDVENLRVTNLEVENPSGLGGTKLYKHTITWEDSGSADIISNVSTQITDNNSFNAVWNSLHNGYYSSASYNSGPIIEAAMTTITYYDPEEGIMSISKVFESDVVTEL